MRNLRAASILALAALGVAADPARPQLPLGTELQVNTYTTGAQDSAELAATPDGGFVVVWSSEGSSGTDQFGRSIQARRFAADGVPAGAPFQLNELTTWEERAPQVAMDADGEFTVAWSRFYSSPGGGSFHTSVRRFDAAGSPQTPEFVVAADGEYAGNPDLAGFPGGEFMVVWWSYGQLLGRRFDPTGGKLGEFVIQSELGYPLSSRVATEPDGEFVVAWQDRTNPSYGEYHWENRVRRFDAEGNPIGPRIDLTGPESPPARGMPDVAKNVAGDFLVVWYDSVWNGTEMDRYRIQAQSFDADAAPLGPRVLVDHGTSGSHVDPRVAATSDGGFVVAWTSVPEFALGGGDGSGGSIRARQLSADGTPRGGDFQVNSYTTGEQWGAEVAIEATGEIVFAWASEGSAGSDDAAASVQTRRFRPALFADGFESGDTLRWSSSAPRAGSRP